MPVTVDVIREFFHYCPVTGVITWRKTRNNRSNVGARVGTLNKDGVWQLSFGYKTYLQHRVAWLYMTGNWPSQVVDHIDGNLANNAWANLRDVSQSVIRQNMRVASSGTVIGNMGVFNARGNWQYAINTMGVTLLSGRFKSAKDAHIEYEIAKQIWNEGCLI